jgi:hypothetical protein
VRLSHALPCIPIDTVMVSEVYNLFNAGKCRVFHIQSFIQSSEQLSCIVDTMRHILCVDSP